MHSCGEAVAASWISYHLVASYHLIVAIVSSQNFSTLSGHFVVRAQPLACEELASTMASPEIPRIRQYITTAQTSPSPKSVKNQQAQ